MASPVMTGSYESLPDLLEAVAAVLAQRGVSR